MSGARAEKDRLRRRLLAARRDRGPADRQAVAESLAWHATSEPSLARARRVAAYVSMPTEPGTGPLLAALAENGAEVVVPRALPDGTLDWVALDAAAPLRQGPLGVPEPDGPSLGPQALDDVDLVLVPALAVDHAGRRLGRGAAYYDRALAGVTALRCAIVFAAELLPEVPHEPHDQPVDLVLTESGLFRPHSA